MDIGLDNPLDNWRLKSILKGIKKLCGKPANRKLPVTPDLLMQMYSKLDFSDNRMVAFWAAATVAFFAFLRKSTIVPKSCTVKDIGKALQVEDVQFTEQGALLSIHHTKTIQVHDRIQSTPIPRVPKSQLCPVTSLHHLQSQEGYPTGKAPLFSYVYDDEVRVLTHKGFTSILRHVLTMCGVDSSQYSGHSFRRGGATWAFKCGISPLLIKAQGDWRSECFQIYVDTTIEQQWDMVQKLSNAMGP
jgi:integrase